jgi:thiol-disulfide isomerase/thioredoxin
MLRLQGLIERGHKAVASISYGMLMGICLCNGAFAQDQDAEKKVVTLSASVSPESVRPGATVLLSIQISLSEGAHANSNQLDDPYLIPTSFTPKTARGISWGPVKYPAPSQVYEAYSIEPLSVFVNGAVVTVPITIDKTAAPGKISVEGSLRIQVCDDEKCYPVQRLNVTAPLNITGAIENKSSEPVNLARSQSTKKVNPSSPPTVSVEVPNFTFVDFAGNKRQFSEFRGKYVLLDFWATWCKPCLADIPHLKELYEKYKDKGFEIIGMDSETLSVDEEAPDPEFVKERNERARQIVATRGASWTHATSETAVPVAVKVFAVQNLPTKILIDAQGRIIARIEEAAELDQVLSKLFGGAR